MAPEPQIYSVSHLTGIIQEALRRSVPFVWVRGEVSDLARPHSGHLYFTLKDQGSQIRAVMWRTDAQRLTHPLKDGQTIVCQGGVDVYGPRGVYQLVVREAEAVGVGALQQRLMELRRKLSAEGLFAAERKRPLPRFPRHVAVVSSPTGAAIHDFLQVIRRRWSGLRISLAPCRVQGPGSAPEVAAAIRAAGRMRPAPDVLVVTRGGGSLEDLWSFNEETVVRAIVASPVPVISAVGHEIDVTLSDLAADLRALTPTEAAERVAPSADELNQWLESLADRLRRGLKQKADGLRNRLEMLAASAVLTRPVERVRRLEQRLDELATRSQQAVRRIHQRQTARAAHAAGQLEALSPLAVLSRGYAVTRDAQHRLISNPSQLAPGDPLIVQWSDGAAITRVESVGDAPPHAPPAN